MANIWTGEWEDEPIQLWQGKLALYDIMPKPDANCIYKNRTNGPAAYLRPGLMLQLKFGGILTGGSGEEDF